ncbi:pyroglutamyl-peptidase I. Cysteine peptidase. MEROPS family C15 [Anaerolinea thermolimosa]|uniref:pyroglutamyl-peptidase I n=1 Tax=Anaerolinea thermolimosa TaxID=229919 RepID=UPI000783CE4F|nr:pyroglutamyl-peptidase I [Anaerolinea thermolimosa]GAP06714.1 pyroglutamyl-peptidase I. Cysteine peptidase. MEROPS family C15 [Anaerolinea thermolimosa]
MKLLLTGFEPFGGSPINPSALVLDRVREDHLDHTRIFTSVLPVDGETAPVQLIHKIDTIRPDIILCLGEAPGRSVISIERVAINLLDYRIPDNANRIFSDRPVIEGAPAAYFSTLPVRVLYDALINQNIPAELSLTAGSYLCNQIFFHLMHRASVDPGILSAGFIHLPSLPEQVVKRPNMGPSMSLDTLVNAIHIILKVLNDHTQDIL